MYEAISKLTRDQRAAAVTLDREEARFLVDTYYQLQHDRITAGNRLAAAERDGEPNATFSYVEDQFATLESQIKGALGRYVEADPVGRWAISHKGIGPVIAAGFLARLDLRPTAGAWWRFCGLDPTVTWGKGQKRPWNAKLKRLCWLTGESFTKTSGYPDAFYGKLYIERKAQEIAKNEAGDFAAQAAESLSRKNYGADTKARAAYEEGKLPAARIHLRAQRYAVKIFLSHLHHVWHVHETGNPPPRPFVIEHLGHAHYIAPPGA